MKKHLIAFTLFFISLSFLKGQPGELDPSFNGDGKMVYFAGNYDDQGRGAAIQPDGRILITGFTQIEPGNYQTIIARFLPDGNPDPSFGDAGRVITADPGNHSTSVKVVVQTDGKILTIGKTKAGTQYMLALSRFLPDGKPDSTFGTGGLLTISAGPGNSYGYGAALQPDGKIVATGLYSENSTEKIMVVRRNPDGSPDSTFGGDGLVLTSLGQKSTSGNSVVLQPDGKIVVAGYACDSDDLIDFAIVRYLSNGNMDSSFGTGGAIRMHLGPADNILQQVAVQPDGKCVAGGYFYEGGKNKMAVLRFTPGGTPDSSFGTGGHAVVSVGEDGSYVQSLSLLPNGKIIAGGASDNAIDYDFALVCLLPDGTPDPGFGDEGKVTTSFGGESDYIEGIAVQPDGKIVAVGGAGFGGYDKIALARYFGETVASNVAETAGKIGQARVFPNPLTHQSALEYELSATETVAVRLFDAMGRCIKTIASPEVQQAGRYSLPLETQGLAPGLYWVNLESSHGEASVKVVK